MADNVTIPASGTGDATPVVATDQVGSAHFQKIKIADGAADSSAMIGGDATNGLDVDVTRLPSGTVAGSSSLPAGTNNIGDVDILSIAAGDNNIGNVDVVTMPTVTVQDGGGSLSVDDNGSSLTVDGTVAATQSGTWNVGTVTTVSAVTAISNALPAGNNNIGDVDVASIAAGDNNIGNVDIVTMPNVTIGTNANLTESLADDAAFTPATSRVVPIGFTFDDVAPDSVNEGDIGAARMSANRNMYTTLRDAAGNERGANVSAGNALLVDASATTQPVSGTVTANLAAGTNNIGDVDILSIAAGDNNIGNVDVVSLPALAAGTNNIGDVDVLSVVPGTSATSLGKAEDAAHTTGDTGVEMLAVRRDANTSLVDTDGDYAPLQVNAGGSLKVVITGGAGSGGTSAVDDAAFTVATDAGTPMMGIVTADSVDSGDVGVIGMLANRQQKVTLYDSSGVELSVGGGTQYTEDAAAAANPVGNALNLVRDDARGGSLTTTDGDNVAARGTNAGELYVKHVDAIPVTDNGGQLTVDGTVAATQSGTWNVGTVTTVSAVTAISNALPAGTNAIGKLAANSGVDIGDVDITSIAAGDNNIGNVDIVTMPNVAQATASNLNAQVVGNIAHDSADSGNPVKIGYKAIAHGANPTAVTADDRTDGYANRHGIPFTLGGHPNIITLEAAYTAAQTDTALVASISSGTKVAVTQVQVTCDNANTVDVGIRVGFGTANTPTTTDVLITHPGIAPGSGVSRGDGSGLLGVGGDGAEVRVTCEVPTGGSVRVLICYFTIES